MKWESCPKCGDHGEFVWIGPIFKRVAMRGFRGEFLLYTCHTCGYTRKTPCLDAKEEK